VRLLALDLLAYGPFTGQRIDLSGGRQGLHILYGPNEAGKSSALRALRALLFGIPARTADAFVHPYDQLRVGARLLGGPSSNGSGLHEIEIVRRKGNKGTLLAPDGTSLPDDLLARLLHGVDEEVFTSLFGLDHDGLVAGGQELLAQGGDVGQALFAAGLGTRSLRRVLRRLDEEAAALYLPRGKRTINETLAELAELRREVRAATLSGSEWEARRRAVEEAERELEQVAAALAEGKAACNRLSRLRRALPLLAERRELRARRDALAQEGPVPALPEGFGTMRREAVEGLRAAREIEARAAEGLRRLEETEEGLAAAPELLAQAETIERLHQQLGQFGKGQADRSRLLGEQEEQRAAAGDLLAERWPDLTLDEAATLQPALARWPLLQELDARSEALEAEQTRAARALREAERRYDGLLAALAGAAAPPDPAGLARAVATARKAGDLDQAVAEAAAGLGEENARLGAELRRLAPWSGTLEDLLGLSVPTPESVSAAEADLVRLAERRRDLASQADEARAEQAAVNEEIEEIRRAGAVPSEDELKTARARRDRLWEQVRRSWLEAVGAGEAGQAQLDLLVLEGAPAPAGARRPDPGPADLSQEPGSLELAGLHERAVAEVDELADRLRREAERVQRQARLLARERRLADDLAGLERAAADIVAESERAEAAWRALWAPAGFAAGPPAEMRAWLARWERLRERAAALSEERRRHARLETARAGHCTALLRALQTVGEAIPADRQVIPDRQPTAGARDHRQISDGTELGPLLDRAEERLRALDEVGRRRAVLADGLRDAEAQLAAAQDALDGAAAARAAWQERWDEAVRGLGAGTSPAEVRQILETLRELFGKLKDAERLERRIAGLDRDAERFRAEVRALAAHVAPRLAGRAAEQAMPVVIELHALLTQARAQEARRAELVRQRERLLAEREEAAAGRRFLEERLADLRRTAGATADADLEEVEKRAAAARDLDEALARVGRRLLEVGEGATLEELEREAAGAEADVLSAELELAERRIEELQGRHGDLREALGSAQRELRAVDGGGRAAEAAGRAEEALARLRGDVEQFARLRLAAAVLRQEIERYRAENQAPLLQRAGTLFAELTLGSFASLATDFEDWSQGSQRENPRGQRSERDHRSERDQPVLAGCRPDGRRARVEQMSDGTRDQLYLALRLATLERYLETSEPLPLVIDDVLINFDDARSAATLRVLAALAEKTQVLLFTHHARVRDLALEIEAPAGVFVQELAPREGRPAMAEVVGGTLETAGR